MKPVNELIVFLLMPCAMKHPSFQEVFVFLGICCKSQKLLMEL